MSGCFDNAVGEVDATDESGESQESGQEGSTSDSMINPSTITTNIAPIVSAYLIPIFGQLIAIVQPVHLEFMRDML